jgi:NAD+ synthase (glutamine-hydrolysing)
MRLVKLGLASVNTTVGAFAANVDRALELARKMAAEQVTVGLFQEQLVGGYPAEDLIQWQGFVENQWPQLERFARETGAMPTVFIVGVAVIHQGLRYNCAAVIAGGTIHGLVPKEKLPTYSIFYEARTWSRGRPYQDELHRGIPFGDFLFGFDFGTLAVEVCEDLWSASGPIGRRTFSGAELVANISASPFRIGTHNTRKEIMTTRAADHQCTFAYANAVGSNDGLIFDGGSVVTQNGKLMLEGPRFVQGYATTVVDLDRTMRLRAENSTWRLDQETFAASTPAVPILEVSEHRTQREGLPYPAPANQSFFLPPPEKTLTAREAWCEDILDALALGIGDYFEKTGAFTTLGIALSGGRDSLLTLLIAHRYARKARPENPGSLIKAFYMPSQHSSSETRSAAEVLCRELGIPFEIVPIEEAFARELEATKQMLGEGVPVTPITLQNIQARVRAQRMWNWANSSKGLFLQTGNMSEKAVGYTTVGGDLMGALAVIANVPKTVVMFLIDYLQQKNPLEGIRLVLQKPPGPELAPNQKGEEELMPFPVLDACFHLFADEKLMPAEVKSVLRQMFPEHTPATLEGHVDKFVRLFLQSIFKWVQSPLSLHIGNLDLERERALQLPVVTSSEWTKGP